jgi:Polysaccharide pyruvyl transferase
MAYPNGPPPTWIVCGVEAPRPPIPVLGSSANSPTLREMPRILLRAHKSPFRVASAQQTVAASLIGDNVGNLVFSQASYRLLSVAGTTLDTSSMERISAGRINETYDHVVIPLANAFRISFTRELKLLTKLLEKVTVPVTILGVGAQRPIEGEYGPAAELDPLVKRFVRAALDRGPSIGVRGARTKDYLRGLGFGDEVRVIGCPSMFSYGPKLPPLRFTPAITAQSPIALTVSPYVGEMGPISLACAERYPRLHYFGQNGATLELLVNGRYPLSAKDAVQLTTGVPIGFDHPLVASRRTLFCLDPATWFGELAAYDFSFGTRIHGSIAALLAGTPAVVLAHDQRTLELAEYHDIPHRKIPSTPDEADPARLYEESDWSQMRAGHPQRWATFAGYLDEHGLEHAYRPGEDRGKAFDATLATTKYPAPVRPLTGPTAGLRYAIRRRERDFRRARLAARRGKLRVPALAAGSSGRRRG